jgi:hypothetical protein
VDQAAALSLASTDLDGDPVTVLILTQPGHGTLSGSGTNYVYQPEAGFLGTDQFTFQATDGIESSRIATVTIKVTDQNTGPTAEDFAVKVLVNTPTNLILRASDPESNPLQFHVVTLPANGKLSGKGQTLLYSPNPFFIGSDRFTFSADDGELESNIATVSIAVDPANHRPAATNQHVTVLKDSPMPIQLSVTDADGDLLLCPILKGPKNGRLAGTGTTYLYTPKPGFTGADVFTYKAWDGQIYSIESSVFVNVTASIPSTEIRFNSVSILPSGQVQLVLATPPNRPVEVFVSTNLVDWIPLLDYPLGGAHVTVIDPDASPDTPRFYRAWQRP